MIYENEFPILEFDDSSDAVITPERFGQNPLSADRLVITFFREVVDRLFLDGKLRVERIIPGEVPIALYQFTENPGVLLMLGEVGCPACAGDLDLLQGMGVKKVMFCGGGGVLNPDIAPGQVMLVDGAIRDEGFSYHYVKPSRVMEADAALNDKIASYLEETGVSYFRGLTWTTDALFRETKAMVERRRNEGASIVEMEQAGCLAIAKVRGLQYGALIYGGDDVSQEEWSQREWRSRNGIRYDLVTLCENIVSRM